MALEKRINQVVNLIMKALTPIPMWKKATTSFLLLNLFLATTLSTRGAAAAAEFPSPAIYVFGDSFFDVGNNNFLPGAPKADFLPYGVDFPGGVATGRFTNGFNVIDFIAQAAGMMLSPPPFLSLSNGSQTPEGENFASGGAGILDATGNHTVIPMAEQIKYFERVAADRKASSMNESLVFISTGTNDLIAIYISLLNTGNYSMLKNNESIIASVVNNFKDQLQGIYDQGVRKFAVLGTTILGCAPVFRNLQEPSGDCIEDLNDLSMRFNAATKSLLEELGVSLKGFEYSFIDLYEIADEIGADPHRYGFTEVKAPCCELLKREILCRPNATYCSDRSRYLFWDGIHPSQAAAEITARLSLYGSPRFAYPINVQDLLKN